MQYKVKSGDSLSLIAKNHGFTDWHLIYDDPQNAAFRQKHPDPSSIGSGDSLFIPDKKPGKQSKAAGETHSFVVKRRPGLSNLKWEPAEGTFGELKSAKLTADTDLAEGTVVHFESIDPARTDLSLPALEGKVSGKKLSIEWPLAELYGHKDLHQLDLHTHPTASICSNYARLKLRNPGCIAEEVEVAKTLNLGSGDKAVAAGMLHDHEEPKRKPNKQHLLQVVADGPLKLRLDIDEDGAKTSGGIGDFGGAGASSGKAVTPPPKPAPPNKKKRGKKKGKNKKLKGKRAKDLQKAHKEASSVTELVEDHETEASFFVALSDGGEAELETRLALSQEKCTKEHELQLSGAKSQKLKAKGEELKLPYQAPPGPPAAGFAKPTVYKLTGKGCKGEKKETTVQVFPAKTLLVGCKWEREVGVGAGGKLALFAKVAEGLNKLLGGLGFEVEPELEVAGTLGLFFGYREEEDDWRVYYAYEFAGELEATLTLTAKVSALRALSKNTLPKKLTKYLVDAVLSVGLLGGLKIQGKIECKKYSPDAGGAGVPTGAVEVTGKIALPIELRVGTGEGLHETLAIELSAKINPALHLTGVFEADPSEIKVRPKGSVDEAELEIGVLLRASFKWEFFEIDDSVEFNWKCKLWHEHEFQSLKGVQHVFYSDKKDQPTA